jgi:hypothetical protein
MASRRSGDSILSRMRDDVRNSPWGAAAFGIVLVLLVMVAIDRAGWFETERSCGMTEQQP